METALFVGRTRELADLNLLLKKNSASLVVIEGRRRIGKSRLAMEFGKKQRFYTFSGLPPTKSTTAQDQRDEFAKQMGQAFGITGLKADDWTSLFMLLAKQVEKKRTIILLDEISWMGTKDPNFLGKLKNAWDLHLKSNPQLILILCGSISAWIEKNILSSTGFLGRISLIIRLEELPLKESVKLLSSMNHYTSAYEKFKILSVTGGVPRYLEEIQSSMTAEENIKRLCFRESGILYREFDDIFSDLFSSKSELYRKIVSILAEGEKEFGAILEKLEMPKSGHVSGYLDDLIKSGFVKRDFSWKLNGGIESRISKYRLSDNYLRFYLKYIFPNKNKIKRGHFETKSLSALPGWESIMGLQFENLVLNNRHLIWEKLHLNPEIIVIDNPYFQRPTSKAKGCQIDYMIQTKYNNLFICEIKFSKNPLGKEVMHEMSKKMESIVIPKGFSKIPVLIHVNGVQEKVSDFFTEVIDFSELI